MNTYQLFIYSWVMLIWINGLFILIWFNSFYSYSPIFRNNHIPFGALLAYRFQVSHSLKRDLVPRQSLLWNSCLSTFKLPQWHRTANHLWSLGEVRHDFDPSGPWNGVLYLSHVHLSSLLSGLGTLLITSSNSYRIFISAYHIQMWIFRIQLWGLLSGYPKDSNRK